MEYKLYIAGARGTRTVCGADFLEFGGDTSCYVVTNGEYALVLDCGSGISNAKELISNCKRVDIVLTHLHYDHILGLLDMDAFPKSSRPYLHGMFDKWDVHRIGRRLSDQPFWPIPIPYNGFIDVEWYTKYQFGLEGEIELELFPSNHPNDGCMIKVQIGAFKMLLMCDYEHGLPFPEELMLPFDILIYDGMYTEEEYIICKGYGHSTREEGMKLAKKMQVKQLVVSHLDPKKNDERLRELEVELQEAMPNAIMARAGMEFKIKG